MAINTTNATHILTINNPKGARDIYTTSIIRTMDGAELLDKESPLKHFDGSDDLIETASWIFSKDPDKTIIAWDDIAETGKTGKAYLFD